MIEIIGTERVWESFAFYIREDGERARARGDALGLSLFSFSSSFDADGCTHNIHIVVAIYYNKRVGVGHDALSEAIGGEKPRLLPRRGGSVGIERNRCGLALFRERSILFLLLLFFVNNILIFVQVYNNRFVCVFIHSDQGQQCRSRFFKKMPIYYSSNLILFFFIVIKKLSNFILNVAREKVLTWAWDKERSLGLLYILYKIFPLGGCIARSSGY